MKQRPLQLYVIILSYIFLLSFEWLRFFKEKSIISSLTLSLHKKNVNAILGLTAKRTAFCSTRSANLFSMSPLAEASMLRHLEPGRNAARAAFTAFSTSTCRSYDRSNMEIEYTLCFYEDRRCVCVCHHYELLQVNVLNFFRFHVCIYIYINIYLYTRMSLSTKVCIYMFRWFLDVVISSRYNWCVNYMQPTQC